jgi:cytochrome c oxidase cbb3-type subunit I/II
MKRILLLVIGVIFTVAIFLAEERRYGISQVARAEELALGEKVYRENCAACHGEKGDGKGPQADRLKTKPRDFTTGIYKFRSTPSGSLPLDDDIFRTISRGVRGTSMLAQLQLSEEERRAVARYVKTFSQRFKKQKLGQPISISQKPREDREFIALGKTLYKDAGCDSCHGPDGKGDGPSAESLKDSWGFPIQPADLTLKPFKSGPQPEDLYRTLSTGLDGTPMPSYSSSLTPKEEWALVFYVFSIATKEKPRGMMGLVGEETQAMMIDMRAAMAGMMGERGMMGRGGGMMDRNMRDMMKDMMGR